MVSKTAPQKETKQDRDLSSMARKKPSTSALSSSSLSAKQQGTTKSKIVNSKPTMGANKIETVKSIPKPIYQPTDTDLLEAWHQYRVSIDLRSVKDMENTPCEVFFRYVYEPFGSSPTITSPTLVSSEQETLLSHSFCSFELAMTPSRLQTYFESVPIHITQFMIDEDGKHIEIGEGLLLLEELFTVPETGEQGRARHRDFYIDIVDPTSNDLSSKLKVVLSMEDFGLINVGGLTNLKSNEITDKEYAQALDLELWKSNKKKEYEQGWQKQIDEISKKLEMEYQSKHEKLQNQVQNKLQEYEQSLQDLEQALVDVGQREQNVEDKEHKLRRMQDDLDRKSKLLEQLKMEQEKSKNQKSNHELSVYNEQILNLKREVARLETEKAESAKQNRALQLQVKNLTVQQSKNAVLESKVEELQKQNETLVKSRHEMKKKYTKACEFVSVLKTQNQTLQTESQVLKAKMQDRYQDKENAQVMHLLRDVQHFKQKQSLKMEDSEVRRLRRERDELVRIGYREDDELIQTIDDNIQRRLDAAKA